MQDSEEVILIDTKYAPKMSVAEKEKWVQSVHETKLNAQDQ